VQYVPTTRVWISTEVIDKTKVVEHTLTATETQTETNVYTRTATETDFATQTLKQTETATVVQHDVQTVVVPTTYFKTWETTKIIDNVRIRCLDSSAFMLNDPKDSNRG